MPSPHPKPSARSSHHVPPVILLLVTLAIHLSGCNSSTAPELISARIDGFIDEGIGDGDQLILVLDTAVELDGSSTTGIILENASGDEGYTVVSGEQRNVLIIQMQTGFDHFDFIESARSGSPITIALDLGEIGLRGEDGVPLLGLAGPAEVELPVSDPAILMDARWVDSDLSSTVNREDQLVLHWDQPVLFSSTMREQQLEISSSWLRLSVKGDQLGSSRNPARFLDSPPSRESIILLGELPHLTIDGIHDHGRARFEGSPSGIAVSGTTILPSAMLQTSRGGGVSSPTVVDIEGDCDPWNDLDLPVDLPALVGYSLTRLPGGKVLLAGGRSLQSNRSGRVLSDAWIIDPLGNHQGPYSMVSPRSHHRASLLAGSDGIVDTEDDVVLITGGWDGSTARSDAEILVLSPQHIGFIPVETSTPSSPRFEHSAHTIPESNTVLLIAGRLDGRLNGLIEQVEVSVEEGDDGPIASSITHSMGELRFPRHQHGSVLFEDSENPLLLIYGGFGNSLGNPHIPYDSERCRVLAAPEAFRIRTDTRSAQPLLIDKANADLPGPRRGLRLKVVGDGSSASNLALLVAGTRREVNPDSLSPSQPTSCRTSYLLEQVEVRQNMIRLNWVPAGRLPVEMFQPCIADLPGGRILVAGGLDRGGLPTAEAAIYDPYSGIIERVCKPMKGSDSQERLLAPRAISLWGGAMVVATSPENRRTRASIFKSGD